MSPLTLFWLALLPIFALLVIDLVLFALDPLQREWLPPLPPFVRAPGDEG